MFQSVGRLAYCIYTDRRWRLSLPHCFSVLGRSCKQNHSRPSGSHVDQPTRPSIRTDLCIVILFNHCVYRLVWCHMHTNVSPKSHYSGEATHSGHSSRFFYYVRYGPRFLISFLNVSHFGSSYPNDPLRMKSFVSRPLYSTWLVSQCDILFR